MDSSIQEYYSNFTAGVTFTSANLHAPNSITGNNILSHIKTFVASQGQGFGSVLRMNQESNRYKYIDFLITYPPRKSGHYPYGPVVGLFYQDLIPEKCLEHEKEVHFKQDFVVFDKTNREYIFVIGDQYRSKFAGLSLSLFNKFIWNFKEFNKNIANGSHYGKGKKFDHHFHNKSELPSQIAQLL